MNEERLNKLVEDTDNALYDLKICQCHIDDLIKYTRKIESSNKNLQSKIDKANEILDKYANTEVEDYKKIMKFYKELRDILKEDK